MAQNTPARGSAIGGWLGGPGADRDGTRATQRGGGKLGLPATGPGAAASTGRKALGLFADWVIALLVTRAIVAPMSHPSDGFVNVLQLIVFGFEVTLLQATTGQSIGQRLTRTRIASVGGPLQTRWLLVRTLLLIVPPVVLALVTDGDGRGLHDRAAGTVILATA